MSHSRESWLIRPIRMRRDCAPTESREFSPYRITCAWRTQRRPRSEVRPNNIPLRQCTRAGAGGADQAGGTTSRPTCSSQLLRSHPRKRRQDWLLISGHGGKQHEVEQHCGGCWRSAYLPAKYLPSNLPVKDCSLLTRDRLFPLWNLREGRISQPPLSNNCSRW